MGIFSTILSNMQNMKKAKKIRNSPKEDILALDDGDFFDAIECVCEDAVFDIKDSTINEEQKLVYSLIKLEAEVNNGGVCQFFVNSSRECAPYVSKALEVIGATQLKELYDNFIDSNNIDVNDLSSFKISEVEDFESQTQRYDFESFDDKFYEDENLHNQIIEYSKNNLEKILK